MATIVGVTLFDHELKLEGKMACRKSKTDKRKKRAVYRKSSRRK